MNQMILILSKFNLMTENHTHSWEATICAIAIALIAFVLFVFWHKKNALINFKAWALLLFVINFIKAVHFSPIGPHFILTNVEYQLSTVSMNFLNFLEFLASAATIFRLWQLSERYIPQVVIKKSIGSERGAVIRGKSPKCRIKARVLALFHTFKNGGNNDKNTAKIRKNIENNM